MYWIYSALLLATLVLSTPWWLWQMLRHGKYRSGWSERLGSVPKRLRQHATPETIWIHAVSVGEVLAVTQLVAELKAQLPGYRIVISTTTDTGQKLARQKFGEENVFRAPLDLAWGVQAFMDALRPRMLVLAESEFWPNLLHCAHEQGVAVAVVNARVSDRSLPRYRRFRWLFARVLSNVDLLLAQSDEDARRLVAIGAPAERVHVGGNLKFDVKTPPARNEIANRIIAVAKHEQMGPLIVAGSTLEGEEIMLLDAFRAVRERYSQSMLILAPRHPERFEAVASLLASSGIPFRRRSQWDGELPVASWVLLLDSIGELAALYEFAAIAFVGGSLVSRGGHNVLEPAYFGVPILVGPHTENFRDIIEIFCRAGALRVVTPQTLTPTLIALLENYQEREILGRHAQEVMSAQQGATRRTADALIALLSQQSSPVLAEAVERQA